MVFLLITTFIQTSDLDLPNPAEALGEGTFHLSTWLASPVNYPKMFVARPSVDVLFFFSCLYQVPALLINSSLVMWFRREMPNIERQAYTVENIQHMWNSCCTLLCVSCCPVITWGLNTAHWVKTWLSLDGWAGNMVKQWVTAGSCLTASVYEIANYDRVDQYVSNYSPQTARRSTQDRALKAPLGARTFQGRCVVTPCCVVVYTSPLTASIRLAGLADGWQPGLAAAAPPETNAYPICRSLFPETVDCFCRCVNAGGL